MGKVPTTNAILGKISNGGVAADDFLQLVSSKGEGILGWIDANAELQGNLASGIAQPVIPGKTLYVDNSRTDSYTPNGSVNYPFQTVTAAINQVVANGDNQQQPYRISIAPGLYLENLVLDSTSLYNMLFDGNVSGGVTVLSLTSVSNNQNLSVLQFNGFSFAGPVTLIGQSDFSLGATAVLFSNSFFNNSAFFQYINNLDFSEVERASGFTEIKATSITSNVLTVTADNSYQPGQTVFITNTAEPFLNGLPFTVVSASPSQFTANFTQADYSNPSETTGLSTATSFTTDNCSFVQFVNCQMGGFTTGQNNSFLEFSSSSADALIIDASSFGQLYQCPNFGLSGSITLSGQMIVVNSNFSGQINVTPGGLFQISDSSINTETPFLLVNNGLFNYVGSTISGNAVMSIRSTTIATQFNSQGVVGGAAADSTILADGTFIVTLDSGSLTLPGQQAIVKNIGSGTITVAATSGTIDGNASVTLAQNKSNVFQFDGVNWWIIAGF